MGSVQHIPLYDLTRLGRSFFLPVGTLLQIEIGDVAIKMNSVAVGYIPETCLIIRHPTTGGFGSISNKLFKGNRITVRYVSEGNVFGFQSELLGITNEPVRLLFLGYPRMIARHSLRRSKRVGCYLPADLAVESAKDGDAPAEIFQGGIVEDISESGCNYCMIRDFPDMPFPVLEVGNGVVLSLRLPGTESEVQLTGEVRRVQRDTRRTAVGVQFLDITEEKKRGIVDYISTVERFLDE